MTQLLILITSNLNVTNVRQLRNRHHPVVEKNRIKPIMLKIPTGRKHKRKSRAQIKMQVLHSCESAGRTIWRIISSEKYLKIPV